MSSSVSPQLPGSPKYIVSTHLLIPTTRTSCSSLGTSGQRVARSLGLGVPDAWNMPPSDSCRNKVCTGHDCCSVTGSSLSKTVRSLALISFLSSSSSFLVFVFYFLRFWLSILLKYSLPLHSTFFSPSLLPLLFLEGQDVYVVVASFISLYSTEQNYTLALIKHYGLFYCPNIFRQSHTLYSKFPA